MTTSVAAISSSGEAVVGLAAAFTDKIEVATKLSAVTGQEYKSKSVSSLLPDGAWNALASGVNILLGALITTVAWTSKGLHLLATLLQSAADRAERSLAPNEAITDVAATQEALENQLWEQIDSEQPNELAIKKIIETLSHKKIFKEGVSYAVPTVTTETGTSIFSKR